MMLPAPAVVPPTAMPVAFTSIAPLPACPENVLPITRVRESVTRIVAPFSYTLKVRARDMETGEEFEMLRQAHSEQLAAAGDVASAFTEEAGGFEQYQGLELLGAEVIDIQRAGTAGVL